MIEFSWLPLQRPFSGYYFSYLHGTAVLLLLSRLKFISRKKIQVFSDHAASLELIQGSCNYH